MVEATETDSGRFSSWKIIVCDTLMTLTSADWNIHANLQTLVNAQLEL